MEAQQYRHLKCSGESCEKVLRIKITPEHYGKTILVTCPEQGCGAKSRVTIPTPAPKPLGDFGGLDDLSGPVDFREIFKDLFGPQTR